MHGTDNDPASHSGEECARLLHQFLVEADGLLRIEKDSERSPASRRAVIDLLGKALWDVFSDNHTVVDADGAYNLGTFRESADAIAQAINRVYSHLGVAHGYMDFYMGTFRKAAPDVPPDLTAGFSKSCALRVVAGSTRIARASVASRYRHRLLRIAPFSESFQKAGRVRMTE